MGPPIIEINNNAKATTWSLSHCNQVIPSVLLHLSGPEIYLGKNKDLCFKCYLSALEKKYENNDSASKDDAGRDLILMDCAIKYLHY